MQSEVKEYKVVSEHNLEEMVIKVNGDIKNGWQPFGSFSAEIPIINEGAAPLFFAGNGQVRGHNQITWQFFYGWFVGNFNLKGG